MSGPRAGVPRDEAGFTLVELLAVVIILGLISFALTEAFIVGLKTTDQNTDNLSRSVAVQALQSFFTADAQSAKLVSRTDPACTTSPDVILHLSWKDKKADSMLDRAVSYSLEVDGSLLSGEAELVRWSCTDDGPPDKKMLGHLSFDPAGPPPVQALCDDAVCPDDPASPGPDKVALRVLNPVAIDLVVQRRAT